MGYIVSLHTLRRPDRIGNKADNLHRLWRNKINIPKTYVCTWRAHQEYRRAGSRVLDGLRGELEAVILPERAYAVRSSANVEDGAAHSFAGQFATVLNVRGVDAVAQAVQSVWDTAESEALQVYMQRRSRAETELCMAVLIQEMVNPVLSGVSFSRNPLTGADEIIVEAVRGDGTWLVQSGFTPLRWVSRQGRLVETPGDQSPHEGIIAEVAAQTQHIARRLRCDLDLEWVYDGQSLYWVQSRAITALSTADVYNNRIAREMTPGLIKPLVWSVSVPVHTRQWVRILNELVGDTGIEPQRLVKVFHYRAYFNMGQFGGVFARLGMPPDSLERMMGVLPPGAKRPHAMPGPAFVLKAPRVAGFVRDKLRFEARLEQTYPQIRAAVRQAANHRGSSSPAAGMQAIDEILPLLDTIAYHTIVSILLMQVYNALLRRHLHARGVDPEQFNLTDDWEDLQAFDPNHSLAGLHAAILALEPQQRSRLDEGGLPALYAEPALADLRRRFDAFLERFGHLSDSTVDLSSVPWRETPEMILRLACELVPPQPKAADRVALQEVPGGPLSRRTLRFLYHRARSFRLYREMFSSLYTEALMTLRDHFHALGDHLAAAGLLGVWEEIFFLYLDELRSWAGGAVDGSQFAALAAGRREEMERSRDAIVPEVIYGDAVPPLIPAGARELQGIPTSGGYYTGPVRVVRGLSDFGKLAPGDVLVIPYSDVSWTPLFACAGAVIAESGGILSHSSIIAREYRLPAVVSVAGAMDLPDGALVEVDGYNGRIYLKAHSEPTGADANEAEGANYASAASGELEETLPTG